MPRSYCAKAVQSLLRAFGKAAGLSTLSTVSPKYLTSQVFSSGGLWTGFAQAHGSFTQAFRSIFNLSRWALDTISTGPTNTTNLIKGF
jgi:hypothetical protein